MGPLAKAMLLAAGLMAGAAIVYGAALVENVLIGEGGLDGPCVFRAGDEEGSSLRGRSSYWPPRTECVVRDRLGGARVEVHEWPWVSAVLIVCAGSATLVVVGGVMRTRFA
jgi:hypothetical protein